MQAPVHAAALRKEEHLRLVRFHLFESPLTQKELATRMQRHGVKPRTVHHYLDLLLKRGDAAVVRSRNRAQETPRYVAAFRGIPVIVEDPSGFVVRRTFGRVTYVSDAD